MRRTTGYPKKPCNEIPKDGTAKPCKDNRGGDCLNINHPLANGFSHGSTKYKKSDKIKECCPDHGLSGRQDPGGNDGRNGIRRIMHSVRKIEKQGDQHDKQ